MKRLHGIYILLLCAFIAIMLNFLKIKLSDSLELVFSLLKVFGIVVLVFGRPFGNDIKSQRVKNVFNSFGIIGLLLFFLCLGVVFILAGANSLQSEIAPGSSSTSIFYRFRVGWLPLGTFNSSSLKDVAVVFAGSVLCILSLVGLVVSPKIIRKRNKSN